MKKIIYSILACVFIFFLFSYFSPEKKINNFDSGGTDIIAFGDSITAGFGAGEGNDYVSLLSEKIGEPIINSGKNGETTVTALDRIDEVLNSSNPKLVIVFIGGNDYLQKIPPTSTFSNIETLIEKIHQKGAMVVLVGTPGALLSDPYKKEFERISEKHNVRLVPQFIKDILLNSDLRHDSIHPNDAGYEIVAETIYEGIKDLI